MSKLRTIINGVGVDGANTFGADLRGIEPITPNTAEVRIKNLMLELIGVHRKGCDAHNYPVGSPSFFTDSDCTCDVLELRQKVEAL